MRCRRGRQLGVNYLGGGNFSFSGGNGTRQEYNSINAT